MKSKIQFDLEGLEEPIVKITISDSQEDLRDKVAQNFVQNLTIKDSDLIGLALVVKTTIQTGGNDYVIQPLTYNNRPSRTFKNYEPFTHFSEENLKKLSDALIQATIKVNEEIKSYGNRPKPEDDFSHEKKTT